MGSSRWKGCGHHPALRQVRRRIPGKPSRLVPPKLKTVGGWMPAGLPAAGGCPGWEEASVHCCQTGAAHWRGMSLNAAAVEPREGRGVWVRFEDGAEREYDVSGFRGEAIWGGLEARKVFEQTHVRSGRWPGIARRPPGREVSSARIYATPALGIEDHTG